MLGLNQDMLIIILIVAVIFGAKKLPELGKGLGKGIKEFKSGISGQDAEEAAPKAKEIEPDDKIKKE
ncbi:MAG: twin-arginine translocase TatA/TatE family subunit [Thermodesulfobacteriota bacterium]|jgi:sec-independent protein translocase protein TatA